MKVEIWSDIVCPFCYIGKRKFEQALKEFDQKENVEIIWRSFQLDPDLEQVPGQSVHEYLAQRKGVSIAQAKEMNAYMSNMAKEVGLHYNFDQAIINNTFKAHQLLHLAATIGKQHLAKERLFAAYYTEGKDIGDNATLVQIGKEIGLQEEAVQRALDSNAYQQQVLLDQYEAQQIGARGVPFFVFNNKYAVSGAQPSSVFAQVLEKVWEEEKPATSSNGEANFCTIDGVCN